MKLLVSWVRDFVDVTLAPAELADLMALRGFEVASVDPVGGGDAVIDFEVTANRPDCLSVLGLAREIGTALHLPVRDPRDGSVAAAPLASIEVGASPDVRVVIDEPELCPRYAAAVADVTPGTTTPGWMAERLQAAGVRTISPLVDITNYVLMELGHPMHAFDLATLAGPELRVRRPAPGEQVTTLDGAARRLEADMLVIADAERAQAVAGVMGGAFSEVSAGTRVVAFESAYFKPASVRRTSKRLGLKTEASARFERGADIGTPVVAMRRALALLAQIGAGRVRGPVVDAYPAPRGPLSIDLRRERLALVLGLPVPDAEVTRILRALGLLVEETREGWRTVVPTFRVDLLREIDLVEEVGRHYGFDKLEAAFPTMAQAAAPPDTRVSRDQLARRVFAAAGLSEAVTFGFIERRTAEAYLPDADVSAIVAVANPLSGKFDVLRPSLLPGLVDAIGHNRRHGRRDVALYEIGARFTATTGETRGAAFAWTGAASEHWSAPPRAVDFFDAKGAVEVLAETCGVTLSWEPVRLPYLVPGQAASIVAGPVNLGVAGQLLPALAERAGAPRQDPIFVAEVDLDRLSALQRANVESVRTLPRYPAVVRDLSIVVSDALPAAIIRGTIQTAGDGREAPLVAVTFFDRYQGKGVPEGSISISVRLTFQAPDRTLTDSEVQTSFDTILSALVREHGAVQR